MNENKILHENKILQIHMILVIGIIEMRAWFKTQTINVTLEHIYIYEFILATIMKKF